MNDQNPTVPPSETEPPVNAMRSPIRPTKPPEETPAPQPTEQPAKPEASSFAESPTNPNSALNVLRSKMETIADEFAQGKINRAQFNAVYKRYSEQRTIIERLLQRDPKTDAWRQVMNTKGHTSFLRSHFEAQPLYYAVYAHQQEESIIKGGKETVNEASVQNVIQMVRQMSNRPKTGVGRKTLANGEWLILALGEHSLTVVIFSLEPSIAQARFVRDLHNDFERANLAALARNWIVPERMVFPQRALMESSL